MPMTRWLLTLALLALTPGCFDPVSLDRSCPPASAGCEGYDFDGDGYASNEDCDDSDGSVYPGANELCDGVDNDCDGAIDGPDSVNPPTWYGDGDGGSLGRISDNRFVHPLLFSDRCCFALLCLPLVEA